MSNLTYTKLHAKECHTQLKNKHQMLTVAVFHPRGTERRNSFISEYYVPTVFSSLLSQYLFLNIYGCSNAVENLLVVFGNLPEFSSRCLTFGVPYVFFFFFRFFGCLPSSALWPSFFFLELGWSDKLGQSALLSWCYQGSDEDRKEK